MRGWFGGVHTKSSVLQSLARLLLRSVRRLITLLGMVSALFLVGMVVGIVLAVLAVVGVVILAAAGVAWLNGWAIVLGVRIRQRWEATA